MSVPQQPFYRSRYGLVSPADAYAQGLRKMVTSPPLTSEFMGTMSYAPTYFYELLDDKVESDGTSIGDMAPSHRVSQECAMVDALGQLPVVAESLQTHTPLDPRAGALVLAQERCEELRQRWQNQPPPAPARSAHHDAPHARNSMSSAQGHAHQVQHDIMDGGNDPPQFARASQNIAAAAILLHDVPEPIDPQERAVHRNLQALVEAIAVQQAESSALRL